MNRLIKAIEKHKEYIMRETLCTSLKEGKVDNPTFIYDGVKFQIKKAV